MTKPCSVACRNAAIDIRALAESLDANCNIAAVADRCDLAGEDVLESEVVGRGGEGGGIRGERQRRDGSTVLLVRDGEFGGEVLGVDSAAAVAEQQELAAAT